MRNQASSSTLVRNVCTTVLVPGSELIVEALMVYQVLVLSSCTTGTRSTSTEQVVMNVEPGCLRVPGMERIDIDGSVGNTRLTVDS